MHSILASLSFLYGLGTRIRNAAFENGLLRTYRSALPVICVGNITAGGNGKTPLCELIVRILLDNGHRPVVLSRGYGGSERGPYLVQESDDPQRVGDEPLLLQQKCQIPVVVSRSRVVGAKFIEAKQLGSVVVLDDGYQHRYLERDLNIVTVDISTPEAIEAFLAGQLLPAGRFRESRDAALQRADLVVFAHRGPKRELDQRLPALVPEGIPWTESYVVAKGVWRLELDGSLSEELAPCEVIAACAIGNPEGFFRTLRGMGFALREQRAFPDHGGIPVEVYEMGKGLKVPVVVSEKDRVKVWQNVSILREFDVHFVVGRTEVRDHEITRVFKTILSNF